jgi:hypothetical protein
LEVPFLVEEEVAEESLEVGVEGALAENSGKEIESVIEVTGQSSPLYMEQSGRKNNVSQVTILQLFLTALDPQRTDFVQDEFFDLHFHSFEDFSVLEVHLGTQVLQRQFFPPTGEHLQTLRLRAFVDTGHYSDY